MHYKYTYLYCIPWPLGIKLFRRTPSHRFGKNNQFPVLSTWCYSWMTSSKHFSYIISWAIFLSKFREQYIENIQRPEQPFFEKFLFFKHFTIKSCRSLDNSFFRAILPQMRNYPVTLKPRFDLLCSLLWTWTHAPSKKEKCIHHLNALLLFVIEYFILHKVMIGFFFRLRFNVFSRLNSSLQLYCLLLFNSFWQNSSHFTKKSNF